jgi:hypothetical protein
MISSHRCNKREISQRKKSNDSNYLYKSNSLKNYLHNKKIKNFESPRRYSLLLMNKAKKDIIIEWDKGNKEIKYLARSFGYLNNYLNNKKKIGMFKCYKFNLNYLYQILKFKPNGNIRINSIFLLTKNLYKTEKEKNNQKINNKNKSVRTKDTSSNFILENNMKNKIIDFTFSKNNYCNYYPKQNEMKEKADKKPSYFPMECFLGVNRFHNEIGKKDFLNLNESNVFNSSNNSYKIIDKKDHVLINHLCKFETKNRNINSITIRYRHKNSTFIYYK